MTKKIDKGRVVFFVITSVLVWLASIFFENHRQMSPVFTVPFFSGAANTEIGKEWYFAPVELGKYKFLPVEQQENYRFKAYSPPALIPYSHYNPGLVYLIALAKKLFFWQGDVRALKSFHVLIHITICLLCVSAISGRFYKVVFLMCYGLNPLVIYFVTFPYLYFWQVLPSTAIAFVLLRGELLSIWQAAVLAIICAVALVTRSTVVFCIVLFFLLLFLNNIRTFMIALGVFAVVVFLLWQPALHKTVWHTAYIGVGAYPNPYMKGLTDNNAFDLFKAKTGQDLYVHPGGNYFDSTTFANNVSILKKEYFNIVKHSPLLLIRNATLNFFQSFSFGYFVDYPLWVSYLSALAGFVFFICLLIKKMYWWIAAIALSGLSFTPYFPPIQAYMFGSYLLIVCAFVQLMLKTKLGQHLHQLTLFSKPNPNEANHPVV